MTVREIVDLLDDPKATSHLAFPSFCDAMRERQYGHEALNDAWCWFYYGWEAFRSCYG